MTTRRARLVLVLVVLGVVGLFAWKPVCLLVLAEKHYDQAYTLSGDDVRGWYINPRWDIGSRVVYALDHPLMCYWFVTTGYKSEEADAWSFTEWHPDGTVDHQGVANNHRGFDLKRSPPWLWNVTDQTAPSMPAWMKDDEKWQAALDAQD